jgi:hypothetical protein
MNGGYIDKEINQVIKIKKKRNTCESWQRQPGLYPVVWR